MAGKSQNGWNLLTSPNSKYLHNWVIPAANGPMTILLRRGPAGFLLAHLCLWYSEMIEVIVGAGDDFGWSLPRHIGSSSEYSNHGSGTAMDLNASKHPQGTFTLATEELAKIHGRLSLYSGAIRWGGDYHSLVDQMHYEIVVDHDAALEVAKVIAPTVRGHRLLDANSSQKQYLA